MSESVEGELRRWLEQALEDCYRSMFFTAASILPNREDAQEITQEASLKAARAILKLAHLTPEQRAARLPHSPKAWLLKITRHSALDRRKRRGFAERTDAELFRVPSTPTPDPGTHKELHSRLLDAIGQLPEKQALTLTLFYEKLREDPSRRPSPQELADELGIRPGTVSKRVFDGLANLRKLLGDAWGDWKDDR
jgi:RNA polymerase sigma factor (sigma-70 family)